MSLVSVEEVEARFSTGLETDALQVVVDQQEAWLARKIGALIGERDVVYRPSKYAGPIFLPRTGTIATIDVDGTEIDETTYTVSGTRIDRLNPTRWDGVVTVTFTPDDQDDVKHAIISLVRLVVTDSPFSSESGEGHSYTRMASYLRQRAQIARALLPNRGPQSVPV